ncbi:MAG: RusA family crossover junction endodeoxyribonuclease [Pedobacter sp.]|jgi:hypothetical protein|uniref:RusA family crossover junction endodeoxyribonuclease n=1 Tax=Pedobacter sp. TaxID=1411316 RepID=UPI003565C196
MFPIEFTFDGPPLSLQSKNKVRKRAYKQNIETIARGILPAGFVVSPDDLEITITYYHDGASPDVDNIIKPIQDALVGVVYVDDKQIAHSTSRKRDINRGYKVRHVSACILESFGKGNDFIHVKVDTHTPSEDLD